MTPDMAAVLEGLQDWAIVQGDCRDLLATLPADCVQTCISSPPYFLIRDYDTEGQIGQEETPAAYVAALVAVYREVRRVLRPDGTCWINLGDSYAHAGKWGGNSSGKNTHSAAAGYGRSRRRLPGFKPKDLMGLPWRVALALQDDGWWLRCDIIWHKPNVLPENTPDRPTRAHEYLFLLSKSPRYYYDADAIMEPASPNTHSRGKGIHPKATKAPADTRANESWAASTRAILPMRHKRSVWSIPIKGFKGDHFATYPPALVLPCLLAGSREGDLVLDPFSGAGTTGLVAVRRGRRYLGFELNAEYVSIGRQRIIDDQLPMLELLKGGAA